MLVLADLPPGAHGLTVYHDLNGNDKLDTNVLGIPREPHGFGHDATGRPGPPDFARWRIALVAGEQTTAVKLRRR